jgi:hypothetical protein
MAYLQTLSTAEAIALVASLQKLKEHLTQELKWMQQQVQQKMIQFQGIETLLAEADSLGLEASSFQSAPPSQEEGASTELEAIAPDSELESESPAAQAKLPPSDSLSAVALALENLPPKAKAISSTSRLTKGKRTNSAVKLSFRGQTKELRELLMPQYQGKTFGDIVGQILTQVNAPLHVNEVLQEMYGDLPQTDQKRAKGALLKLLSAGKVEGKWQSLGQGIYVANQVTTTE